jgi:hypothetical protein
VLPLRSQKCPAGDICACRISGPVHRCFARNVPGRCEDGMVGKIVIDGDRLSGVQALMKKQKIAHKFHGTYHNVMIF